MLQNMNFILRAHSQAFSYWIMYSSIFVGKEKGFQWLPVCKIIIKLHPEKISTAQEKSLHIAFLLLLRSHY